MGRTSAIYMLEESLWFFQEGNLVPQSSDATAIVVIDPSLEARIGERPSVMFAFAHILKKHTLYRHCVLNSPQNNISKL